MVSPRFKLLPVFCAALSAAAQDAKPSAKTDGWQSLFDGKTLEGWAETPFHAAGKVRVADGALVLEAGSPLTGVNLKRLFPKSGFELRFEARKLRGGDFFATVTFPIGDSFCTWVNGGWGGDIVGLSSIDGWDASENETRTYFNFESGRWYGFRLLVRGGRVTAWIDEKQVIDVNIAGRTISLRPGEIELSAPFGFATYSTTGMLRKVEYRAVK